MKYEIDRIGGNKGFIIKGKAGEFCSGTFSYVESLSRERAEHQFFKDWRLLYREGFRCVPVSIKEIR